MVISITIQTVLYESIPFESDSLLMGAICFLSNNFTVIICATLIQYVAITNNLRSLEKKLFHFRLVTVSLRDKC